MGTCNCGATWTGFKLEHCPGCHQSFTGTAAGDMHRVGDHDLSQGPGRRRCLTISEMEAKGMAQNGRGVWMTRRSDADSSLTATA